MFNAGFQPSAPISRHAEIVIIGYTSAKSVIGDREQ